MSPSDELEVSTNHRHRDECLPGPSEDSLWLVLWAIFKKGIANCRRGDCLAARVGKTWRLWRLWRFNFSRVKYYSKCNRTQKAILRDRDNVASSQSLEEPSAGALGQRSGYARCRKHFISRCSMIFLSGQ